VNTESEEGLMFGGTKTGRIKARHLRMYPRMINFTRIALIFETGVGYDTLAINTLAMGWTSLILWKCRCVRSSLYMCVCVSIAIIRRKVLPRSRAV